MSASSRDVHFRKPRYIDPAGNIYERDEDQLMQYGDVDDIYVPITAEEAISTPGLKLVFNGSIAGKRKSATGNTLLSGKRRVKQPKGTGYVFGDTGLQPVQFSRNEVNSIRDEARAAMRRAPSKRISYTPGIGYSQWINPVNRYVAKRRRYNKSYNKRYNSRSRKRYGSWYKRRSANNILIFK